MAENDCFHCLLTWSLTLEIAMRTTVFIVQVIGLAPARKLRAVDAAILPIRIGLKMWYGY
jgi:hypothetical protein